MKDFELVSEQAEWSGVSVQGRAWGLEATQTELPTAVTQQRLFHCMYCSKHCNQMEQTLVPSCLTQVSLRFNVPTH